jgi:hypothetical protein
MKTSIVLAAFVVLGILACSKDKFQTVPSLRVKSISTDVVPFNGSLTVRLEFTDKEGDVHDSIWVKKQRLNRRVTPTIRDSILYKIPDYPDKTKGEFEITLDYQSILSAIAPLNSIPATTPPSKESDTLNVKFAVRDKAGHISDSVSIGTIVVRRSL